MANTTQQLKLADGHHLAKRTEELHTTDPQRNGLIHIGEDTAFPDPFQGIFKKLPPEVAVKAHDVYLTEARRPRRIDYIWMESFFPGYCVRQELFGRDIDDKGRPASDHFGVLTTFTRNGDSCTEALSTRESAHLRY